MDIYYSREHSGTFVKIAKYPLTCRTGSMSMSMSKFKSRSRPGLAPLNWRIDITRNKNMVLLDPNSAAAEIKPPGYIQNLLIGLMRDPMVSQSFKIKVYVADNRVWCKFYVNSSYVADICSRYGLAPDILAMVIKKSGQNSAIEDKPYYDDSEIPIFRNESRIWSLNYDKYLKITPYDYQHNNIQWLRAAEEAITRRERHLEYVETSDLLHFKNMKFEYYLDPMTSIIYDHDSIWNCKFRCQKYVLYGGVLCDEVGLGKTLSMTGLILSDKYRSKELPCNTKILVKQAPTISSAQAQAQAQEAVPVKVKVKVKAIIKPRSVITETDTQSTESEESDPSKKKISIIKRDVPLSASPNPVPVKTDMVQERYRSETTLVACPRRLVSQWISEIQKYTGNLHVIEMSTLTHIKKYNYTDLDDIDVVVVSFSLFDNKNYIGQDYFQLEQVHWRRVIIDEGHEVLLHQSKKRAADLRVSTAIFSLKSDFRWVCTGTPLSNTVANLQAILSYLNNLDHNELSPLLDNINRDDYKRLMELVFHRNTRESIKEQITIPQYRESVELLDFTKTERAIYDSIDASDITRKLQVCTNLSVSETDSEIIGGNILNLNQVTKAMGAYYMQNCDRLEIRIESYKEKITDIEAERDSTVEIMAKELKEHISVDDKKQIAEVREDISRTKSSARNRIKTLTEHIGKCQIDLSEYRKQLQTFRSLDLDHISRCTCPIMGTPLKGRVAITSDGYYYSVKGVELMFLGGRKIAKCACTRKPIEIDSLTFVDTEAKQETDEDIDVERSKWGTKMSHIVNKLRKLFMDDPDGKVIIFSQWKKMLLLMAKALKDCNINHVFCRGNVHMMSKSIRSFKTDPKTRVILLSSDSCNSGSNLTEAPYVFLIDAVSGNIEYAKAAETQAIARTCRIGQTKEVQVHRFVIRDSVEEIYYKQMQKLT
jgi:SNF2 family DNA or RNA helicase